MLQYVLGIVSDWDSQDLCTVVGTTYPFGCSLLTDSLRLSDKEESTTTATVEEQQRGGDDDSDAENEVN